MQYTGSWSDDVMSGSESASGIYYGWNTDTQSNTYLARRIGGRTSQGTQGEKGALKLYNRLVDTAERDYDSIMPAFIEMAKIDTIEYSISSTYLEFIESGNKETSKILGLHLQTQPTSQWLD